MTLLKVVARVICGDLELVHLSRLLFERHGLRDRMLASPGDSFCDNHAEDAREEDGDEDGLLDQHHPS